jgi:hypothetical protein
VALSRPGHPAYDLLTLVAGIEPASPGFASVRIAPHLGDLLGGFGGISASSRYDQGALRARGRRPDGDGQSAPGPPGRLRVAGERAGVAYRRQQD